MHGAVKYEVVSQFLHSPGLHKLKLQKTTVQLDLCRGMGSSPRGKWSTSVLSLTSQQIQTSQQSQAASFQLYNITKHHQD